MSDPHRDGPDSPGGRGPGQAPRWLPATALATLVLACLPLLVGDLHWPAARDFARWIYAPDETTPLLVIAVAGWLLHRRWRRLLAAPAEAPGAAGRAASALLASLAAVLLLWARATRASDLLLPSLLAGLLAFAIGLRGGRGAVVVGPAALALALGTPIPEPLRNEAVWALQQWTAQASAWLLAASGAEVARSGVVVQHAGHSFVVVESCSGLRGVEILVLTALVIRELFRPAARGHRLRSWLPLLAAPLLGLGLNVVRVAAIVLSDDPEVFREHTAHGVVVLGLGSAVLYGLALLLEGRPEDRPSPAGPAPLPGSRRTWILAAASGALLCVASFAMPPFANARSASPPSVELPQRQAGWVGEDVKGDADFTGLLLRGPNLHRRYERPGATMRPLPEVTAFIAYEDPESAPSGRLFTSRLPRLEARWEVLESGALRLWLLGVEAEVSRSAAAGGDRALVYHWRVRDRGLLAESLRAFFALDASPLRRAAPRAVVRLSTPLRNLAPLELDRGKKVIERFVQDFRSSLTAL